MTTVLERLLLAGVAEHRAYAHLRYGRVRVDGVPTTDPNTPAPHPTRVVIHGVAEVE